MTGGGSGGATQTPDSGGMSAGRSSPPLPGISPFIQTYWGINQNSTGNNNQTPAPVTPPVVPFGGGPQTPTVNLNNIAPGTPSQQPPANPLQPPPIQPPAPPMQPQGIPLTGQANGISFNQAYAPISESMQRDNDFHNWLQSIAGR